MRKAYNTNSNRTSIIVALITAFASIIVGVLTYIKSGDKHVPVIQYSPVITTDTKGTSTDAMKRVYTKQTDTPIDSHSSVTNSTIQINNSTTGTNIGANNGTININ